MQGDYTPHFHNYPQNPNPNPTTFPPPPSATATTTYCRPSSDYYTPYPQQNPYPAPSPPNPNPQIEAPHAPHKPYYPPYDQYHTAPDHHSPLPSLISSNPNSLNHRSSFHYTSSVPAPNYPPANENSYGGGVYAYQGGKIEPYGSRGTAPKSSTLRENVVFDDFGRPIGKDDSQSVSSPKIVKAVPKVETREDVKDGGQKFRVKLLAQRRCDRDMDVLCQIGFDGIRMLDPITSETLKIHPLETITRCAAYNPSTFAFWPESSVDFEPRCVRLQSNIYTTNTLLDTVTAATIQLKEMGGRSKLADAVKVTQQSTEKKKGLGDWMNIIRIPKVEKEHWVPDGIMSMCTNCGANFGAFNRRHHCRNCGDIFCYKCTEHRTALTSEENAPKVRVCDFCLVEVTHKLSIIAKEAAISEYTKLQSHEDLTKKLQEELERNCKISSGSNSNEMSRPTEEVACPTCTVHLQVQVPSSGSETIECGVCQHPFLVSAH